MNSANDKYGSSLDRTLGASKPVDPATRLSELLAQSLEELTRPFDPPRPGAPVAARSAHEESATAQQAQSAQEQQQPHEPATAEPEVKVPEDSRLDADRALAEL